MKRSFINKLIFPVIFLLFLPLTWLTPRNSMDDYSYAFSYKNEGQYLVTFKDFVSSMIAHYTERHGRIWANGVASVFSANDFDWLFKLLNAAAFVALIYLSIRVLDYDKKNKFPTLSYIGIAILFWFLIPVPGQTLLWMCGSLNYLWPSVFILLWLIFIKKSLTTKINSFSLVFFFSILAGWQNEAFSAPIIGALFIYFLIQRTKYPRQTLFLIGGFVIGSLFLIFSPGTIHRAGNSLLSTDSMVLTILFRFYTFGMLFIGLRIKATLIVLFLLLLLRWKDKKLFYQFVQRNFLLLLIIGCSIAFIVVVAYVEDRGLMGIELFSIFLLYRLLQMIYRTYADEISYIVTKFFVIGMGCLFIYDYTSALSYIYKFYLGDKQIISEYIKSDNGLVCSPFEQKDYANRFIFYCNSAVFQEGITMYFNYHLKEWKPFHLIPKPYYKAINKDPNFFIATNRVTNSDGFYTLDEGQYYLTKLDSDKSSVEIVREYKFNSNSFIKKHFPCISETIEQFYSHTNIRPIFIHSKGEYYLFVNKLKRMLPGLEISNLSLKYVENENW